MKKRILMLCMVFAILPLILISASAEEDIEASLSGRGYLLGGEQITLTYSISDIECCGIKGNIVYDPSIVKPVSSKSLIEGWTFELISDETFLSFSNDVLNAENNFKGGNLFEVTFQVDESFSQGDICSIVFSNVEASNLEKDIIILDAEYKKECAPPRTGDFTLQKLLVEGSSLTPAFSPDVKDYTIVLGVDHETTQLELTAETTNEYATYEIIDNILEVGNNTVIIRVTADNGDQCDYTIKVKRNHSSDQPQSSDSRLSAINLSDGRLSPDFSPDIYRYIVYIPYEAKNIDISPEPMNAFARSVSVEMGEIDIGYNEVIIRCVAEDTTSSEYVLIVYVMDKFDGTGPSSEGKRQLSGALQIQQEKNEEGSVLVSAIFNSEQSDATYDICWYVDGKMVTVSNEYTIEPDEEEHSLIAVAKGKGDYSGYVICDSPILLGDISGNPGSSDNQEQNDQNKKQTRNVVMFVCVIVGALFLFIGLLIGELKGKKKILNKLSDNIDADGETDDMEQTISDDQDEKTESESEIVIENENGENAVPDIQESDAEDESGDISDETTNSDSAAQ